jgi:hypothetical protein
MAYRRGDLTKVETDFECMVEDQLKFKKKEEQ